MNNSITIQERTEKFAVRVIKAYCELNKRHFDDAGKVLAKQFLRSGTSIGKACFMWERRVFSGKLPTENAPFPHKTRLSDACTAS